MEELLSYHVYSSSNNYSGTIYSGVSLSTSQTALSPDTQYSYHIYGVNPDGVESTAYASVSIYTLSDAPVLNSPASPTNSVTPPISNSFDPDPSFANQIIQLYVDGASDVSTTANSSGSFTF